MFCELLNVLNDELWTFLETDTPLFGFWPRVIWFQNEGTLLREGRSRIRVCSTLRKRLRKYGFLAPKIPLFSTQCG